MERLFSPAAAPLSLLVSFPAEDRRLSRTRYQHLLQVLSTVFHHILGPYISLFVRRLERVKLNQLLIGKI